MTRVLAVLGFLMALATKCEATAPVPEAKPFQPTVFARLKPIDELLADSKFVARLIGRALPTEKDAKEFVNDIDRALDQKLGEDWRKAIDASKPLVAYGFAAEKLETSPVVIVVPIRDESSFLKLVAAHVGNVEDLPNGVRRFVVPAEWRIFGTGTVAHIRFSEAAAIITLNDVGQAPAGSITPPAAMTRGPGNSLLAVTVAIEQIPKPYRDHAVAGIKAFKSMLRGEGEPAGGMVGVIGLSELLLLSPFLQVYPFLESVVQDGQRLRLDLKFDKTNLDFGYDIEVTPRPGSNIERQVAAMKPLTSRFANWPGSDSAAAANVRLSIPEDLRTAWSGKLEEALNTAPADAGTQAAAKLAKSFLPTLRAGEVDLVYALKPSTKAPGYTLVAGVQVGNGRSIEDAVRELKKNLPGPATAPFKLDAGKIEGAAVHEFVIPPNELGLAKPVFGDGPIRFTILNDVILGSFGKDADELLAAGMKVKSGPQNGVQVVGWARRLAPFVAALNNRAGQMFDKVRGEDINRINVVEVRVDGGKTLTIRHGLSGTLIGAAAFGVSVRSQFPPPPPPVRP